MLYNIYINEAMSSSSVNEGVEGVMNIVKLDEETMRECCDVEKGRRARRHPHRWRINVAHCGRCPAPPFMSMFENAPNPDTLNSTMTRLFGGVG